MTTEPKFIQRQLQGIEENIQSVVRTHEVVQRYPREPQQRDTCSPFLVVSPYYGR